MSTLAPSLVLIVATMVSGAALAAEESSTDVTVAEDLTAVIALQAKPCGRVVSAARQGDDDYLATCEDGNRYRIFVDDDGRVIVAKLD
jgi:hypothetical protein